MLKSSIILVLLAVAASCDKITDKFHTIGSYDRAGKASKTWFLSTWTSTWSNAVKECKSYGMKLATFGSDEQEADELLNLYSASSTHPDAFIGYTDEEQEGTFTTFEGEKLQISLNFHTNEPNDGINGEDCLELYNLNNEVKYNDVYCNNSRKFICVFENNCQLCDRFKKDIIRLQNALYEAELNLKRKDELLSVEKSKHGELVIKLQNDLSESNLNLQLKQSLLDDANKNLQLKDSLLEFEKSSNKYSIEQLKDKINNLNSTILQKTIDERTNLMQKY